MPMVEVIFKNDVVDIETFADYVKNIIVNKIELLEVNPFTKSFVIRSSSTAITKILKNIKKEDVDTIRLVINNTNEYIFIKLSGENGILHAVIDYENNRTMISLNNPNTAIKLLQFI